MKAEMHTPAGVLSFEREQIEITSNLPQPLESWRFTDAAGHEHYYADGYPTLASVVDYIYWCTECRDNHDESHLECPLCHEHIRPATYVDTHRKFMPGRTSYYLDGQPIDEARWQQLWNEARSAPRG